MWIECWETLNKDKKKKKKKKKEKDVSLDKAEW